MISWLLFGALALPNVAEDWSWQILLYAVLSLTVIRMLPVAISLLGARIDWRTVAFIGWFGPRGLASIVFALIAREDLHGLPGPIDEVVATIALTRRAERCRPRSHCPAPCRAVRSHSPSPSGASPTPRADTASTRGVAEGCRPIAIDQDSLSGAETNRSKP